MIRLAKSSIGPREQAAVSSVLDAAFLGMGREVRLFEGALTTFIGRPALAVVNGTAALQLALEACGIGLRDEVLVPSFTYVATFQAISATGARPIACDIDPRTLTLDPDDASRRLTTRTRAIVPVHYGGDVGDLDAIYALASLRGLRVVEDAAHAVGTLHRGRRVGATGDVVCFSFDGIKNLTCGEGGAIVTADPDVRRRVEQLRVLGMEKDVDARPEVSRDWDFDVTRQGWRAHMSNVMAAIGLAQLERFSEMAATRQRLARRYDDRLRGHARVLPIERDYAVVVPHLYSVRLSGVADRPALKAALLAGGIEVGLGYQPNHRLTRYGDPSAAPFPVTDAASRELLTLPLHADLTEADVDTVCEALTAHLP